MCGVQLGQVATATFDLPIRTWSKLEPVQVGPAVDSFPTWELVKAPRLSTFPGTYLI